MAKKGAAVMVEGRLQSRSFETAEGGRRSVIEIRADHVQFLDRQSRELGESQAGESDEEDDGKDLDDAGGEEELPF